jgi:hypothetical protein
VLGYVSCGKERWQTATEEVIRPPASFFYTSSYMENEWLKFRVSERHVFGVFSKERSRKRIRLSFHVTRVLFVSYRFLQKEEGNCVMKSFLSSVNIRLPTT